MDWIGNAMFIPAISLLIIGLTWGGNEYPWASAHVLAPLIVGVVGVAFWAVLEYKWVEHPTVPFRSMANRTTWLGFGTTFIHGISSQALYYYCESGACWRWVGPCRANGALARVLQGHPGSKPSRATRLSGRPCRTSPSS